VRGGSLFGYILPEKPELKIKEYEIFKAYYCGICKSIRKKYGQLPRLTLNYDSIFFVLLISCLDDKKPDIVKERCVVHPFKKRNVVKNNKVIDYISDINVLLAYYNLKDNWNDDRSAVSAAGMIALESAYKKIKKKYEDIVMVFETRLGELDSLEKEKCNSMDMAADSFAKLLEEVLAYKPLLVRPEDEKIIRWIGYNTGKWIYLIDAFDDIKKDIESGAYNPLIYQYSYDNSENIDEFKKRIRDKVYFNLTYCLSEIGKAYELMDVKINSGIIENIIYMGMLRKTEQILYGKELYNVEKSI